METKRVYCFDMETVIRKYSDMVYRLAVVNTKNKTDADDIFQETFVKLLRYQESITSEEHLKAWLIRVTINSCRSCVTSVWNKRKVSIDSLIETAADEADEDYSDVFEAVKKLDSKYREVIHLFYYEDFSIKEIAEILDCKESTVKTRLSRGRKKLNKALKGNYGYERTL